MALPERNDPETNYSDAPGTRALVKGSAAVIIGVLFSLLALVAASLAFLPALVILFGTIPLAIWGAKKLRRNEPQIRPQS